MEWWLCSATFNAAAVVILSRLRWSFFRDDNLCLFVAIVFRSDFGTSTFASIAYIFFECFWLFYRNVWFKFMDSKS